jgi:dipeptidyl aminopeptidase/acylaminoacyl peptidase
MRDAYQAQLAPAGERIAAVVDRLERPWEVAWRTLDDDDAGWRVITAFNAAWSDAPPEWDMRRYTWTAHDGLEIEGLLVRRREDAGGAPRALAVNPRGGPCWPHRFGTIYLQAAAAVAAGYAVLLPNPRGSTGRGWQFQRANTHDWMGGDYRDSQLGLDALIERGIADPERLGVGGWSYGGYTTAWTITQTGRFKAAIVGAGASNRTSASGTTDMLRWAQTWFKSEFAEDPDEYWRRSPVRYIAQTTTPTLILHGELDARVPTSQGVELYNQLRAIGATTQLVIYPREPHTIGERQHQRDLLERVIGWFDKWVKG